MIRIFDPVLPNKELVKQSIDEIFETGQLTNFGKYCQLFEERVKNYVGCKYALAVSNCDTALRLCIAALKMGNMEEVVVPTFTFNSTWMALNWNFSNDYLVDINPKTLLIDLNKIEKFAKVGFRHFLLVNVFGNVYDIDELNYLRDKYNLNILLDSAHSFGSSYKGKKSGGLGYTECFSFSATKAITCGEGGVVCTDDEKLYNQLKYMRNYGFQGDYNSHYLGLNGKFNEMNAIVGYYSMDILDSVLSQKKRNVSMLKANLKDRYEFQEITSDVDSSYKDFVLLNVNYEKVSKELKEKDIQHKRYFLPLHMQDFVKKMMGSDHYDVSFSNSEKVYNNSVCIPAHAKLTNDEIYTICETLNNI